VTRAADSRRGRKDPYTCGGRKWKRCPGTEPGHMQDAPRPRRMVRIRECLMRNL